MSKYLCWYIVFCLGLLGVVWPQSINFKINVVSHLNTTSKLLIKGDRGYAATTGGLVVYDVSNGQVLQTYTTEDGLYSHFLTAVDISQRDILILGSYSGYVMFLNLKTGEIVNDDNLLEREIVDIAAIEDTLWVVSKKAVSIYIYDTAQQKYRFMDLFKNFSSDIVQFHNICYADERVWLGSDIGLVNAPANFLKVNLKAIQNWQILTRIAGGLPATAVLDIAVDASGGLLLATDSGLLTYDGKQFTAIQGVTGKLNHLSVYQDQVLAATDYKIFKLENNQLILSKELGSGTSKISTLLIDANGNIWTSLIQRGIFNLTRNKKIIFDGPLDNNIGEVLVAKDGRVWCTSEVRRGQSRRGVFVKTDKEWINYRLVKGASGALSSSHDVFEDAAGNIWVGSWGGGMLIFDRNLNMLMVNDVRAEGLIQIRSATSERSMPIQTHNAFLTILSGPAENTTLVTDILADKNGRGIWIVNPKSRKPLIRFKGRAFSGAAFSDPNNFQYFSLPFSSVVSEAGHWFEIRQDLWGDLWMISDDTDMAALQMRLQGDQLVPIKIYRDSDPERAVVNNSAISLGADENGFVWIGSNSGLSAVLNHRQGIKKQIFSQTAQPIGLQINDIWIDSQDNKWFATNKGLSILKGDGASYRPESWIHLVPMNTSLDYQQLSLRPNVFQVNLPSENLHSVFLDEKTSDVYLGSDQGLAIIRSNPFVSSFPDFKQVKVGPNPFIIQDGKYSQLNFYNLMPGSEVKILTANGQLIRTLSPTNFSEVSGAYARWDGKTETGKWVHTGVYVYLITNESGKKNVGKVMVIRK